MKKLLLYLFIFAFAITAHHTASATGQQVPQSLITLSTATDIRAFSVSQPCIVQLLGISSVTDGNNGFYSWNATSTAADDGFATFAVSGITTGRWIRLANGNTLKLSVSVTPVALQLAYTVSFGTTLPVVPVDIQVQSTSLNGALVNYVTTKSTTGFTLNFASVPIGVATFDVLIIKN